MTGTLFHLPSVQKRFTPTKFLDFTTMQFEPQKNAKSLSIKN